MIPGPFAYHRPTSIDEAVSLLASFGDEGRVVAGGHSLIPMMKLRLAVPEHLVDLQALSDLKGIAESDNALEIGAMTTQADLLASDLVARACPLLQDAAAVIADPQVRACGTLGGNVANGDPGNDMPAVMQCLDATYHLKGPEGERTVAAQDFYEAAYFTALEDGEIVTKIVRFACTRPQATAMPMKSRKRKVGDYATAAAAVDH